MKRDDQCWSERVFLMGVIGFLTITAGLKLFGVMGEEGVWSVSDPVVPLLTVRQSTLAACALGDLPVAVLQMHVPDAVPEAAQSIGYHLAVARPRSVEEMPGVENHP